MATMKEFERKLINREIGYLRSEKRGSFYIIKDHKLLENVPYCTIRKLSPSQLDQLVDKLLILFLFS
jgi:hypothetical protein